MDSTAQSRLKFAVSHGIDVFLFIRDCFEIAPLVERKAYWDDLVLILSTQFQEKMSKLNGKSLSDLLKEYQLIHDIPFDEKKSIAILPPGYDHCPLNCRYKDGQKRKLASSQNVPTKASVFELDGTARIVSVLKRVCRGCECVLEYDMLFTKRGYQFYAKPQRYIRITPNIFFARDLCKHIVSTLARGRQTFEGFAELWMDAYNLPEGFDRKWVSTAFYRHEIEAELRESPELIPTLFASYNSYDDILPFLERSHIQKGFSHTALSSVCLEYKCSQFQIVDAIWSINFPHCAALVQYSVSGFPNINLPPICPNQPEQGLIYCRLHSDLAHSANQPVTRTQLQSLRQEITVEDMTMLLSTPDLQNFLSAIEQSTAESLSFNDVLSYRCSKNIGSRSKKRKTALPMLKNTVLRNELLPNKCPRSRGLLINVRPCGHVNSIIPIYKAESPSQVFLAIIANLYKHVRDNSIPPSEWPKQVIVYDNMCNLNRIHSAQNLLPLPPPYDRVWLDSSKVIDVFHLVNHRRPECKTTYSPKKIKFLHPDLKKRNTEAAEQTNSWLKRFKSVLNSIPRNRQLFYLHRLVKHRNAYLYLRNNTKVNNQNLELADTGNDTDSSSDSEQE